MAQMPQADQFGFVQTLNNTGYMTTYLDDFSQEWVNLCRASRGLNADIGAAYGVASLAALEGSSPHVLAIDVDQGHLDVLRARAEAIGAGDRLQTIQSNFPDFQSTISDKSLENVLICRVLHFFDGPKIERAIRWCFQKMHSGGRLVLVNETPYLRNFQSFIPMYEQRRATGEKFPGFIEDVKAIAPERAPFLPPQMHLLDEEVLTRVCKEAGFEIERTAIIPRPNFPLDVQLDGRESVGVIARKV